MLNNEARTNFGQGVLEIQTYETANLRIVDPGLVSTIDIDVLATNDWEVLKPSPERRKIDDAVFDALGLTQGERDAVYEGVTELVENRLRRARSVRGYVGGTGDPEPKDEVMNDEMKVFEKKVEDLIARAVEEGAEVNLALLRLRNGSGQTVRFRPARPNGHRTSRRAHRHSNNREREKRSLRQIFQRPVQEPDRAGLVGGQVELVQNRLWWARNTWGGGLH